MRAEYLIYSFAIIILFCLGGGVWYLLYRQNGDRLVRVLTLRVALSLLLFATLLLGWQQGWLFPHNLGWLQPVN